MTMANRKLPACFSPALRVEDPEACFWLRQVNLRMRREISWMRHQRGTPAEAAADALPSYVDEVQHTLDLTRFWEQKQRFFQRDPTARYLTEQLAEEMPRGGVVQQGSFGWAVRALNLDALSCFVLATALSAATDNAVGSVIAACLNEPSRSQPTLGLVQKLWDRPEQVLAIADPLHPLYTHGLVEPGPSHGGTPVWDVPLSVPPPLVRQLLFPSGPAAFELAPLAADEALWSDELQMAAGALSAQPGARLQIVPIMGPHGAAHGEVARALASRRKRSVVTLDRATVPFATEKGLHAAGVLCWLRGVDLFLEEERVEVLLDDKERLPPRLLPPASLPVTLFVSVQERPWLEDVPSGLCLPPVEVPPLSHRDRIAYLQQGLGPMARELEEEIAEGARRFRYGKRTLDAVAQRIHALPRPVTGHTFLEVCRAEVEQDLQGLTQHVHPRFTVDQLVLPRKQHRQFEELIRAAGSLTTVHYDWGTASAWSEGGITALFAGPPGTGKTMGAEIVADTLDLPMYRVDLSQVVNKYIGETEKNLKRLFDAADTADVLLFFDEADALFGRRTEVRDAHDRYANLEVSYLLERMERFKGVAVLATNRRKDLDEAFLRRLHYMIEFPMPEEDQRRAIWELVVPDAVDACSVDFDFLARNFQLSGGHIRSIIFQACLQRAAHDAEGAVEETRRLGMEEVVVALKRELDKLDRPFTLHQFGPYADLVEDLEHPV